MRLPIFLFFSMLGFTGKAQTLYNLEEAKIVAKAVNKLILLDFTATWCGPCKKMDAEFWHNKAYKNTTDKFVIAKIDIDQHRQLANAYNITAIPAIKVIDLNGDELMDFRGYSNAGSMEKELAGFPVSVGDLYLNMEFEKKNKPNAQECLYVASAYQSMAQAASGAPKIAILKQSNAYFAKCKKKHPTDSITQKADIGRAFNYVLEQSPEKAIEQINMDKTHEENKPFALYILARAYALMNDKANTEKHLAMLEAFNDAQWTPAIAAIRKELE